MPEITVRFLALLAAGLAAGGALCIVFMDRQLGGSAAFYTEYKQLSIRALTFPLPALGVVAIVCASIDAYFLGKRDATLCFRLTVAAVLLNVMAAALTRVGHFPINDEIMKWETAPATWTATQARWSAMHAMRTATSIGSFVLLLLANLLRS